MVSIKVVLNFLALLTFAQFYNYFSLLRLHLFLLFIVVVIIGFVLGCYFAFRTNEYVMPNLEPRLIRPYREVKNDHLDDLVNYRVHQAIINYLNSPKSIVTDHPNIESDPNDLFCSIKRQGSFKAGNNSVTNRKNKIWTAGDNSSLSGEVEFDLGNSDNVSSGGGEDVDETAADLLSLDEENESQSNSKVDAYLEDLLELFVRDYIMSWLFWLIWEKDKFGALAKSEFRSVLTLLRKRLRRLDYVKIVSRDLIYRFNQHFMAVRRCSTQNEPFKLNYYEMDPEKEREHLRNITEIFLLNIFPEKSYFRNNAARYVIRELLVNLVFFPSLELVCDPDFINQRILFILGNRENVRNSLNNKFAHAATFEDFIKLIKSSNNVDELKQLHYKIMNEIMQATIISEFKSSSKLSNHDSILPSSSSAPVLKNGVITCGSSSFFASFSVSPDEANGDSDMAGINAGGYFLQSKSSSGGSSVGEKNSGTKSDTLRTRNNKIYIKQLRYAKLLCERRINRLNNPAGLNRTLSSTFYDEDANDLSFENKLKNRKIVPIDTILNSSKGRSSFLKYLEHDGSDRLLRFWIDVEKLNKINPRKKYELANKIYEIYLNTYDSPVRDEIGKDLNKSMQLFLMGNNTDEGFYKAQEKIKSVLEYDHYPSFIVTDLYEKALEEIDNEAKNTSITDKKMTNGSNANMMSVKIDSQNQFKSGTDPNKVQVENLVEKLSMKMSALNAFKSNGYQQCDSKLVEVLKNDIEKLKHDITIYESHIQKTELWCDNIGKWKTKVVGLRQPTLNNSALSNASLASINQVSPSSSAPASTLVETLPLFEIHVELHDDVENKPTGTMLSPRDPRFREGWVIYRTYRQFEILHESLMELMSPDIRLKFKRIPSSTLKRASKSLDDEKSRQISKTVDEYLRMICTDESLSQSEALYTFLCPSPDYFKRSNSQNLQNAPDEKFSITSIFKSLRQKEINTAEGDEYLDRLFSESYLKSLDSTNAAKDSIAEPFYYLLEELFDIKGMKKLFRKSFILFVQLTYGATINRIIRERVYSFVLSDEYVSFYLKQLKDSFWSYDEKTNDYTLLPPNPIRSDEEKQKTKKHAKLKLLANIPETLSKLVGEKNSQIGVIKLFEMFQDKNINKHLVYSIIELFMTELFPEVPLDQINKLTPRPEI